MLTKFLHWHRRQLNNFKTNSIISGYFKNQERRYSVSTCELGSLYELVKQLKNTTKISEKVSIIKSYPQLHPILETIIECVPLHITRRSIELYEQKLAGNIIQIHPDHMEYTKSLTRLLKALHRREVTGNVAKNVILSYVNNIKYKYSGADLKDLVMLIIDRDLKFGMSSVLLSRALSSPTEHTKIDVASSIANDSFFKDSNSKKTHIVLSSKENFAKNRFPVTTKDLPIALGYPIQRAGSIFEKKLGTRWLLSRKIDGIRCITRIDFSNSVDKNFTIKMFSRAGNLISGFASLELELSRLAGNIVFDLKSKPNFKAKTSLYLDGELCILLPHSAGHKVESISQEARISSPMNYSPSLTENEPIGGLSVDNWTFLDREDFRSTLSAVLRKMEFKNGETIKDDPRMVYFLFDLIDENRPEDILSVRLDRLHSSITQSDAKRVRFLPQMMTIEPLALKEPLETCRRLGWEGLILRRDCEYVGKRT